MKVSSYLLHYTILKNQCGFWLSNKWSKSIWTCTSANLSSGKSVLGLTRTSPCSPWTLDMYPISTNCDAVSSTSTVSWVAERKRRNIIIIIIWFLLVRLPLTKWSYRTLETHLKISQNNPKSTSSISFTYPSIIITTYNTYYLPSRKSLPSEPNPQNVKI